MVKSLATVSDFIVFISDTFLSSTHYRSEDKEDFFLRYCAQNLVESIDILMTIIRDPTIENLHLKVMSILLLKTVYDQNSDSLGDAPTEKLITSLCELYAIAGTESRVIAVNLGNLLSRALILNADTLSHYSLVLSFMINHHRQPNFGPFFEEVIGDDNAEVFFRVDGAGFNDLTAAVLEAAESVSLRLSICLRVTENVLDMSEVSAGLLEAMTSSIWQVFGSSLSADEAHLAASLFKHLAEIGDDATRKRLFDLVSDLGSESQRMVLVDSIYLFEDLIAEDVLLDVLRTVFLSFLDGEFDLLDLVYRSNKIKESVKSFTNDGVAEAYVQKNKADGATRAEMILYLTLCQTHPGEVAEEAVVEAIGAGPTEADEVLTYFQLDACSTIFRNMPSKRLADAMTAIISRILNTQGDVSSILEEEAFDSLLSLLDSRTYIHSDAFFEPAVERVISSLKTGRIGVFLLALRFLAALPKADDFSDDLGRSLLGFFYDLAENEISDQPLLSMILSELMEMHKRLFKYNRLVEDEGVLSKAVQTVFLVLGKGAEDTSLADSCFLVLNQIIDSGLWASANIQSDEVRQLVSLVLDAAGSGLLLPQGIKFVSNFLGEFENSGAYDTVWRFIDSLRTQGVLDRRDGKLLFDMSRKILEYTTADTQKVIDLLLRHASLDLWPRYLETFGGVLLTEHFLSLLRKVLAGECRDYSTGIDLIVELTRYSQGFINSFGYESYGAFFDDVVGYFDRGLASSDLGERADSIGGLALLVESGTCPEDFDSLFPLRFNHVVKSAAECLGRYSARHELVKRNSLYFMGVYFERFSSSKYLISVRVNMIMRVVEAVLSDDNEFECEGGIETKDNALSCLARFVHRVPSHRSSEHLRLFFESLPIRADLEEGARCLLALEHLLKSESLLGSFHQVLTPLLIRGVLLVVLEQDKDYEEMELLEVYFGYAMMLRDLRDRYPEEYENVVVRLAGRDALENLNALFRQF